MQPDPIQPALWCRTLGGLTLYADRTETRLLMEAGKPVAVLAYLALAPENKASRDHVAELFWPGCDLQDARHSLRQVLYRLREATGGTPLVRARGTELELLPSVDMDCLEAERLAADGDRLRAYELLRGNFLESFSIPESREFESWAEAARLRFREVKADVARELAEGRLAAGEPERALEIAEGLLGLHPFSPAPIDLVMRALAQLGRHATALARFHAYADLLRREIEEEPAPALQGYAHQLEEYVSTRPEPSAAALPFVGRARQWAALEASWEGARASHGGTVLVEGVAGLGKSRLLTELQQRVQAGGGVALTAKCYEIEHAVPYAAIAAALAAASGRSELAGLAPAWLAEAARLLPELRERFPGIPDAPDTGGSPGSKRRLHQALLRCFGTLAEDVPLLLAVDDIHWADAPTLEVLHLLSHRLRDTKVLIVASYRPAELTPVARQFARALCGDRAADLLVLDPLEASDVADLLNRLGHFEREGLPGSLAEQLHVHSAGNPLFLHELLSVLERRRWLVVRDGHWHVAPEASGAELPRTLGKLLADRVDGLVPWMRACVETLAVVGQEVPIEVLAHLLHLSEPRAELALSVLDEERLLKRVGPGVFELVHDELRHLVYYGIPDERRRLLHAAVGAALEAQGEVKRSGGAARLAYHFDQAGDREQAHRYALAAAGEAEALAAPGEQRAHLDVAEAHAPRALPPIGRVEHRGWRGFVRRHGLVAAGAALLALLSAAAGFLYAPALAGGVGYRQGTIYLRDGATSHPTHRLRWPIRRGQLASVEALRGRRPGDPRPLFVQNVTDRGETHSKVFTIQGADTVQVTFGVSDDFPPEWAPDGSRFLLTRGWRASETHYQQNVFLADSSGRIVRPLTDSPWQDLEASWSPAGTRLTFRRDSAGVSSVWIADADGADAWNVTGRFGLPRAPGSAAFAPNDHRLAIVYADTGSGLGAAYVVDIAEPTVRPLPASPPGLQGRPVWAPDGRWLAYVAGSGDPYQLWVVSTTEPGVPVLLAELPSTLLPSAWSAGERRYAATVAVEPSPVTLGTGRGLRAVARVMAPDGEPVSARLRWSVGDTSIATVDEVGFVRGRSPGTTILVASAGGFRADTTGVSVVPAPADTLFLETWRNGLDTTRWTPFGHPRPFVRHGLAPDGRSAFFSNGDYNHQSGAISVARFDVRSDGLTLDVDAWLRPTGQHWQNWQVSFGDNPSIGPGGEAYGGPASVTFFGSEPTIPVDRWGCATQGLAGEQPSVGGGRWMKVTLIVRPDGWCECWVDGRMVGAGSLPEGFVNRPLAIYLRGMSVGTELYHGRLVVIRGLKY